MPDCGVPLMTVGTALDTALSCRCDDLARPATTSRPVATLKPNEKTSSAKNNFIRTKELLNLFQLVSFEL